MKVKYFDETDTLYIEFQGREIAETRNLDENTILDLDATRLRDRGHVPPRRRRALSALERAFFRALRVPRGAAV